MRDPLANIVRIAAVAGLLVALVAAALFHGNAAPVYAETPDTTAPTLNSAAVVGNLLMLTYDEALDTDSEPDTSAYSVTIGSSAAVTPESVAINEATVVLTLAAAVTDDDTVTVTYTAPANNPVQDASGNAAAALTDESVANRNGSTLVSNLGQFSKTIGPYPRQFSQSFTTGCYPEGYYLSSVRMGVEAEGNDFSASIYSGSQSGVPRDLLHTLILPTDLSSGVLTFTAPADAKLEPNTNYSIVISPGSSHPQGYLRYTGTNSDDEDPGRNPGWGISPHLYAISANFNWRPNTASDAARIAVNATPIYDAGGLPSITGTPHVGETLSVTTTDITDAEGTTKAENADAGYAYTYQWFQMNDCRDTAIPGANSSTYTLADDDAGKVVKVRVSYTDDADNDEVVTSNAWPSVGSVVRISTKVELSLSTSIVYEHHPATSISVMGTLNGEPRTTDTTVTVVVGKSADQATEGTDYESVDDTTLTIQAGELSGMTSFTLTPTDDGVVEENETVSVTGSTTATGLSVTGTTFTIGDTTIDPPLRNRTRQVRQAIVRASPVQIVDEVTAEHLANIRTLPLGDESITSLASGDFNGLTGLEILLLNDNDLSSLPSDIFDELTSLTELNLLFNSLASLPPGLFDQTVELRKVTLIGNELTTLPPGLFDNTSELRELDMSWNDQLATVPQGLFQNTPQLTTLLLRGGVIESVPVDLVRGLSKLFLFHLGYNKLNSLPDGFFVGLKRLQWLYLNTNDMRFTVYLEKVEEGKVKAVVPVGAPFDLMVDVTVENGSLAAGASTITIPQGTVESDPAAVERASGSTDPVTVDIQRMWVRLPAGITSTWGYQFVKADSGLPVEIYAEETASDVGVTVGDDDGDLPADSSTVVPGNWALIPSGLGPGDEFRLLAKTKSPLKPDSTSTDIADYNGYVQEQVRTRGHVAVQDYAGDFRVLGSTVAVNARTNTGTTGDGGVPIYWLNGERVADDYGDFYDGTWNSRNSGRGVAGDLIAGESASGRQLLCTGTADDGTTTDLPLGGGDPDNNGISECTATSIAITSGTLSGDVLDVSGRARYLSLSNVFQVGSAVVPVIVALSLSAGSVDEDAGATSITVTGTLNGLSRTTDTTVTVDVGSSGDTAVEGTDYETVTDLTLTIDAGETSGTASFTLTTTDDDVDEGDETLSVTGTTTETDLSVSGTTATIVDDDQRGVAVSATALTVPEGGTAAYTVALESQPTGTVTVTPSVSGDADVTVSPSSLSFSTGDWNTAKTVTVSAAQDGDADDDAATVSHAVSGGDYASETAADVDVMVADDDGPQVTVDFEQVSYTVAEGSDQAITVTLSADPGRTVVIPLVAVDQGGVSSDDYSGIPASVAFASGETETTFTVSAAADFVEDAGESVRLDLGAMPAGVTAGTVAGTTVSITDNPILSELSVADEDDDAVDLRPAFDQAVGDYAAVVSEDVAEVTVSATRNHGGAAVNIIQGDGTTTAGDEATVSLGYGENVVSVEVTAGDGVTAKTYRITITREKPWSATLTVQFNDDKTPASSGYSAYGSGVGSLSDQFIALDGNLYKVLVLMHHAGGLYLGTKTELPGDFTLHIGDLEFRGSESSVPMMRAKGAYWWALDAPGWTDGEEVAVSITVPQEGLSVEDRPLAPPAGWFTQLPASHDGSKAIVFRITFSDTFEMDFRTLRDHALEATNGEVRRAKRVNKDSNLKWEIRVKPEGTDDVVITLPATEDCADDGALCTSDGRMLYNTVSVTIPGP